ncbi:MAG TPA: AcrB/AcrD/AcrF family protein, partial [Gammaproteobacteria bacterium]|nr:AcrB/AcrD/AcrF family protein [Gammaproteobacteria bacterium]
MNNMVAWMAKNPVAANLLMLLILIAGALNFPDIRKETFPEISLDMVVTSVAYPGASSEEVEQSVCVRIEEKIHDLEGIKQLSSTANEGLCAVSVEVELNYDTAKMLDDIKARVDSITSFPDGVERPSFREVEFRRSAIGIAISGQTDDLTLKKVAEKIRDDLTSLDSISQVDLLSAPTPEIR